MLKKARAGLETGKGEDERSMSKAILDSSHQIWLAGLGAFSKAQQEGMKVFDTLVKQGESVEAKTRAAASQTAEAARDAAKAKAAEMQARAGETWDKLEQVFEERVARALGRLGVYTSSDIEKLAKRVNALSESVNALLKAKGIKTKRTLATRKHVAQPAAGPISPPTDSPARAPSTTDKKARKTAKTEAKSRTTPK